MDNDKLKKIVENMPEPFKGMIEGMGMNLSEVVEDPIFKNIVAQFEKNGIVMDPGSGEDSVSDVVPVSENTEMSESEVIKKRTRRSRKRK